MKSLLALLCSLSCCFAQIIDPYRFAVSTNDLTTGLVAYWKLEESSGTRAATVGFGITVAGGDPDVAVAKIGNGADFELSNTDLLGSTDQAVVDFNGNQDFTIAFWFKFESSAVTQYLVSKDNTTGNQQQYAVSFKNTSDRLAFQVSSNGSTAVTVNADNYGTVPDATWLFIVAWHNASADTINIQVNNGTLNSASHASGLFNGNEDFLVGARGGGASPSDGVMDELGVWNRILTADERTLLYNSGAGLTHPFP